MIATIAIPTGVQPIVFPKSASGRLLRVRAMPWNTLGMDFTSPGNLKMDHHAETNFFFVKLVMDYLL